MKDLLTIAEIKELALNEELTVTRIEQNGSGGYAITGFNSVEDAESFANDYNLNLHHFSFKGGENFAKNLRYLNKFNYDIVNRYIDADPDDINPLVFNESGSLTRHEIGVLLPRE